MAADGSARTTLAAIHPVDLGAANVANEHLNALTKPPGSLGHLEEIVRRYAAIRREGSAEDGPRRDRGFRRGSRNRGRGRQRLSEIGHTRDAAEHCGGGAAISVLAKRFGYELRVFDVGVEGDSSANPFSGVTYRRIGPGTHNFLNRAAMSRDEARRGSKPESQIAHDLMSSRTTLIGIGEMGIANSTSATAVLSAATGIAPARLAGRGTGIDEAGLKHKIGVIERALQRHRDATIDGLGILAAVGGFEIAGMAGVCLGGAAKISPW